MFRRHIWHCNTAQKVKFSVGQLLSTSNNCSKPSPLKKRNVVVFDVGHTLCFTSYYSMRFDDSRNRLNDMLVKFNENPKVYLNHNFQYPIEHRETLHIFFPHLKCLFDYIMSHDGRITFFSSVTDNTKLLDKLLTVMYPTNLVQLKNNNQFSVISPKFVYRQDYPPQYNYIHAFNRFVKDLKHVLRGEETINDVILVDDEFSYAANDQQAFIQRPISDFNNSGYYYLGLFKSYFESPHYGEQSLREFMSEHIQLRKPFIRPINHNKNDNNDGKPDTVTVMNEYTHAPTVKFEAEMILLGLQEVRKSVPEAIVYDLTEWTKKESVDLVTSLRHKEELEERLVVNIAEYERYKDTFHHTTAEVEAILDSILSGQRFVTEPTMAVFMKYLKDGGLSRHEKAFDVQRKYLQVLNKSNPLTFKDKTEIAEWLGMMGLSTAFVYYFGHH